MILLWSKKETDPMARNDSVKVPPCDRLCIAFHGPGSKDKQASESRFMSAYSLSVPRFHTMCFWAQELGPILPKNGILPDNLDLEYYEKDCEGVGDEKEKC